MRQSDDFGESHRRGTLAEKWDQPFAAGKNQSGAYEWVWRNMVFSVETGKSRIAGYIGTGLKRKEYGVIQLVA